VICAGFLKKIKEIQKENSRRKFKKKIQEENSRKKIKENLREK